MASTRAPAAHAPAYTRIRALHAYTHTRIHAHAYIDIYAAAAGVKVIPVKPPHFRCCIVYRLLIYPARAAKTG